MKRNPLSRTTGPPPPDDTPRSARRRRETIFSVVGFFAWPAVVFALAHIDEGRFPEDRGAAIACIILICVSSLVWLFSSYVLYDTLFQMAEARWPAAKLIRQFLNLIFQMLRAFGPITRQRLARAHCCGYSSKAEIALLGQTAAFSITLGIEFVRGAEIDRSYQLNSLSMIMYFCS